MMPAMPETVGPYRLERSLGRGGMGEVYAAWDQRLHRRVALKHLLPENGAGSRQRERIRREARAVAQLEHPAIVQIFDLLESPGGDWIVMQYVEGSTLAELLRHGPLPPARLVALGKDVAGALEAAHRQGLLHRDLKTENVILTPGGQAKVLDFGLVKLFPPEAAADPTLTAGIVGTYRAMSPEQANGLALDPRSDLFSLGVLLYEAATAVSPFKEATPIATLTKVCTHQQRPARELEPAIPAAVSRLIDSLLEKDPARRPATAASLWRSFEELSSPSTGGASRSSAPAPPTRDAETVAGATATGLTSLTGLTRFLPPARGWRRAVAALGALAVLAAAAGTLWLLGEPPAEPRYVVVARPLLGAAADGEQRLAAAALEAAILRALASLEGIVALTADASESDAPAARLARIHAADEVVVSVIECASLQCLVTLRRQRGSDGSLLEVQTYEAGTDDLALLSTATDTYVRSSFPGFEPRRGARALAVRAADYPRFLRLQRLWAEQKSADLAPLLAELSAIRASSPSFVEAYLLEARMLLPRYVETRQAGDLERALALVEEARSLAPGDPQPLALAFRIDLVGGRSDEAAAVAMELDRLVPGDVGALYRQALLADARGDGQEALALLRQAADRHPSADYLLELARLHLRQGDPGAARAALEELLRKVPAHLYGERQLAQLELQYGDPARAAELYGDLLERRRGYLELSNLGLARMLTGDFAAAALSLEEAYRLAPQSALAALNFADAQALAGRRDAGALYQRVVELVARDPDPEAWQVLTVKAQALAHLGRGPEAAAAIQKALAAAPDNAQAAYEAALVFAVIGDRSSALASAERALAGGYDRRWFTVLPYFASLERLPAWSRLLAEEPSPEAEPGAGNQE